MTENPTSGERLQLHEVPRQFRVLKPEVLDVLDTVEPAIRDLLPLIHVQYGEDAVPDALEYKRQGNEFPIGTRVRMRGAHRKRGKAHIEQDSNRLGHTKVSYPEAEPSIHGMHSTDAPEMVGVVLGHDPASPGQPERRHRLMLDHGWGFFTVDFTDLEAEH